MRSLFVFSLAISSLVGGCTRANPDAFSLPTYDLSQPSNGGGSGGGTAGGGGGVAGGGGVVSGDLAVVHDLAIAASDLAASTEGVKCGATVCSAASKDACCLSAAGSMCIAPNASCTNGVTVSCDGPEDCTNEGGTCCGTTSATAGGKGASCGSDLTQACVPLCHTLSDCPLSAQPYTVCCATTGAPYEHCSRTPCK